MTENNKGRHLIPTDLHIHAEGGGSTPTHTWTYADTKQSTQVILKVKLSIVEM